MRERVKLSGGSFSMESRVGEGTTIRISWPWEEPDLENPHIQDDKGPDEGNLS